MKSQNFLARSLALGCIVLFLSPTVASASGASMLLKQLGKYAGKQSVKEGGEALSKEAGEALAQRVAQKLTRTGGEASIETAGRLVARGGPDVLRTVDSLADPMPVLRALDELAEDQVATAASRLASGSAGKELAQWTTKHGASVLRAEVRHPGLASKFVRNLGDEGAELASKLGTDQAVAVAKHADDMAKLPQPMRSKLVAAIGRQPERYTAAMGRFVRDNPGKVLFTVATTGVILSNPDAFLGTLGADGTVAPGLIDRTLDKTVTPVINRVMWVLLPALAIAALILLFRFWSLTTWIAGRKSEKSADDH